MAKGEEKGELHIQESRIPAACLAKTTQLIAISRNQSCFLSRCAPGRCISLDFSQCLYCRVLVACAATSHRTAVKSITIWDLFAFAASGHGLSCRSLMTPECSNKRAPGGLLITLALQYGLTVVEYVCGFACKKKWSMFLRSVFPFCLPSVPTDVI